MGLFSKKTEKNWQVVDKTLKPINDKVYTREKAAEISFKHNKTLKDDSLLLIKQK